MVHRRPLRLLRVDRGRAVRCAGTHTVRLGRSAGEVEERPASRRVADGVARRRPVRHEGEPARRAGERPRPAGVVRRQLGRPGRLAPRDGDGRARRIGDRDRPSRAPRARRDPTLSGIVDELADEGTSSGPLPAAPARHSGGACREPVRGRRRRRDDRRPRTAPRP